ncbi:TatD family hydrolase [Candidatus Woesearchaeota archaeon]|nr:TatD family hydrolase [Candidatus Woesearchaeota archaeon]
MKLVDVHCHLNHESFKKDLPEVIEKIKKAGVVAVLVSGTNPESNKEVLALAKKYPLIKASLGIYPIDAIGLAQDEDGSHGQKGPIDLDAEFAFIEENLEYVTAIGEIGMDFHWADKEETHDQQAANFRKIIRFAIKVKKPIVIHTRKAEKECLDILEEEVQGKIPVDLHCFGGKKSLIRRAAELGFYCSVPPNIVRSHSFQTLVKIMPITQLLTETDAPYLSPVHGERNDSSNVPLTIQKIAEIKGLSEEKVADQIWKNYVKVFGNK